MGNGRLAWQDAYRLDLPTLRPRSASFIGAPELDVFPHRFRANTVLFGASLELPILHHGLRALSFLPSIFKSVQLDKYSTPLRYLASLFERFGSDEGGCDVKVVGRVITYQH